MTEVEKLEKQLRYVNDMIEHFKKTVSNYEEARDKVQMNLNRARRLEREELQNDK